MADARDENAAPHTTVTDTRWDRVQDLYHEALARPAATREEFLRDACAGDAALLADVQSLLDQPVSDEQFLTATAHDIPHVESGRRLGGYEIEKLIGRGGMGEVYRARDTKLGRDVAIKVLPRVFTSDPNRLARFEREARLLASLNHPHIGAIYGTVESDGIRGLVLELVEGATLADRAAKGPVPPVEVIAIARQIADALEAAHNKGIVHRDLKPANITITPDGHIKVLDFGLAKVFARGDGGATDVLISEVSGTAFRAGALIGTPAYMSPEQARGHAIDKRTDIWAFGCVLYELLTGRQAFVGASVSDTVAKILEGQPDWKAMPATVPPALVRWCGIVSTKTHANGCATLAMQLSTWTEKANRTSPRDDGPGSRCSPAQRLRLSRQHSRSSWHLDPPRRPTPLAALSGSRLLHLETRSFSGAWPRWQSRQTKTVSPSSHCLKTDGVACGFDVSTALSPSW